MHISNSSSPLTVPTYIMPSHELPPGFLPRTGPGTTTPHPPEIHKLGTPDELGTPHSWTTETEPKRDLEKKANSLYDLRVLKETAQQETRQTYNPPPRKNAQVKQEDDPIQQARGFISDLILKEKVAQMTEDYEHMISSHSSTSGQEVEKKTNSKPLKGDISK